ncbi:hypothetical protein HYPGJ_10604 [Hyphomicrobium sp. GJ21]|nr:hypothetical protein HYPGJ_10604 [Hyphomicrobium sp. GJ21]
MIETTATTGRPESCCCVTCCGSSASRTRLRASAPSAMPKAAARTKVEIAEFLTRTSADTLDMCCPTEDRQEGRSRVPSPVKLKRSHQVYVPACCPAAEAEDHRNVPETRH